MKAFRIRLVVVLALLAIAVAVNAGNDCQVCAGVHDTETNEVYVYCQNPYSGSWGTESCQVTTTGTQTTCVSNGWGCYYIDVNG